MEKTKVTLHDKLRVVGDRILLSKWNNYYLEDKEIIDSIKRKIIEPYEQNPVVNDVINRKSTFSEIIRPIENKADKVKKEYEQIRFIKKFDPEKEIFGKDENLIAEKLEDILDIKKTYSKKFIGSEKVRNIVDKVYGIDMEKRFGYHRFALFNFRNGLPIALAAVYLTETSPDFFIQPGDYHIGSLATGFFGEMIGTLASAISGLLPTHFGSNEANQIGEETDRLKKRTQFLDETITELYR